MNLRNKGVTQKDISKEMNISRTIITKLESGKHEPKIGKFLKYCKACGVKTLNVCELMREFDI